MGIFSESQIINRSVRNNVKIENMFYYTLVTFSTKDNSFVRVIIIFSLWNCN